jgi:quercetin dioxygenase-like cupin family protein
MSTPNGPFHAAELIEYQEGSVVSRILIKKGSGSVTVFAFDRDQELSEHTVPHDAMVQIVEGEAEISLDGLPHRLRSGDALLLPGNVPHAVRATQRFKMVLTMLREPRS